MGATARNETTDNKKLKRWTKEEEEILAQLYGSRSIPYIARTLKVDKPNKVIMKAQRMNLPASYKYQGLVTMTQFAKYLGISVFTIKRWINQKGFPHKNTVTSVKKTYTLIDVTEFWKWAYKNKDEVNFSRIQPRTLLPEPSWFYKERDRDKKEIPERRHKLYTKEEDELLWRLYYLENKPQKEIAAIMDRTFESIRKRLARIRKKKKQELQVSVDNKIGYN